MAATSSLMNPNMHLTRFCFLYDPCSLACVTGEFVRTLQNPPPSAPKKATCRLASPVFVISCGVLRLRLCFPLAKGGHLVLGGHDCLPSLLKKHKNLAAAHQLLQGIGRRIGPPARSDVRSSLPSFPARKAMLQSCCIMLIFLFDIHPLSVVVD